MSNYKKKKVLILGGSSDIGVELSKLFIKKGWSVTVHYSGNNLNFFKKFKNNKIQYLKMNFLTIRNFKKNLSIFTKEKYDSVINLIGYINNKSFNKMEIGDLHQTFQVNTFVPLLIQRNILNSMIKQNWGRILNCGSIGVKYGGGENSFCYSFSKHALEFIPSIYKDLSKKNILINNLRIGVTNTKIHKKIKGKNLKKRTKLIPIGRMAKVTEIIDYIYFLSSQKNTYITGETLSIAGGE
jgi:3-oxoacyl-[acyl-carrier protein] reductase